MCQFTKFFHLVFYFLSSELQLGESCDENQAWKHEIL